MSYLGQENPITDGLVAMMTPLAQAGMQVGISAQKAQVNKARVRAGKAPCSGQVGQPYDCPPMFSPGAQAQPGQTPQAADEEKPNMMMWAILLGAVGVGAFLFLRSK